MIFHSTVQDTVPPTGIKTISKNKIQKMGKFVKRKTVRIFVSGCENYMSVDAGCGCLIAIVVVVVLILISMGS